MRLNQPPNQLFYEQLALRSVQYIRMTPMTPTPPDHP